MSGTNAPIIAIDKPGQDYKLKFAYAPLGVELFSVETIAFDVTVGRCSRLSVVAQPTGVILGQPFDSAIMVEMQVCFCVCMCVYLCPLILAGVILGQRIHTCISTMITLSV
jgi:hypothetical protein